MKLSIVTTLYRSEPHVDEFIDRIVRQAEAITGDFEVVLVNDGSPDGALGRAVARQSADGRIVVVDLARNYGHHKAIRVGLGHARGERVFLIDVDLEEEPELLGEFHAAMADGEADVVYGVQRRRKGGFVERWTGAAFYKLFNLLSPVRIPENTVTARLMTRRYVDGVLAFGERDFFFPGIFELAGFVQRPMVVTKRSTSPTTYSMRRKFALVVQAITSFSSLPLVFIFYLGLIITMVAGLAGGYLIVRRLIGAPYEPGWASIMVSVWFLGGIMIFCLGLIGIYLSKVYLETKRRPDAIVRRVYGRESED